MIGNYFVLLCTACALHPCANDYIAYYARNSDKGMTNLIWDICGHAKNQ